MLSAEVARRHVSVTGAVLLFALALLAGGCLRQDAGQRVAVSPTASPEPERTSAPILSRYGITFQMAPYLGDEAEATIGEAVSLEETGGFGYGVLPRYLSFTFPAGYASEDPHFYRQLLNLGQIPQIVVYPAAEYAAISQLAGQEIALLRTLLADRPEEPGGDLPYLPLINAAEVLHAQLAYLEFGNGRGLRYVTTFAQEMRPVNNQDLLYTFQGLTDDDAYYVAAFFPLTAPILPDTPQVDDVEEFAANFPLYLRQTKAALDQLAPAEFAPDLGLFDAVVTSLRVEPEPDLRGGKTTEQPGSTATVTVGAPVGFVYRTVEGGLWQIDSRSQPQLLTERRDALPAPDAAHAVYMDDEGRLWLINLADGGEKQLAEGVDLSTVYRWGDASTLLVGVWLAPEESEGSATGHVATLDINSGALHIVDEKYVSLGRPALSPDGQSVAYDISPFHSDVSLNGRIYRPDTGSQPIDPALFDGLNNEQPLRLYNPAWSPDGTQLAWLWGAADGSRLVVFDLARQTAITLHTWQPAQFGALPPSPVWSPDGRWLAIEVWANNEEETGLWLLPADGTAARLVAHTGHEPQWLNTSQLLFVDYDENRNSTIKLFELDYGETWPVGLPPGSSVLLVNM